MVIVGGPVVVMEAGRAADWVVTAAGDASEDVL